MRALSALPAPLLALIASLTIPAACDDDVSVKIEVTTPMGCSRPSKKGDTIAVHYRGTLESTGVEFDQSYKRGAPFKFTLGGHQVIQGWDQGLLDMCPGEGRKLTIPPELGYGDRGAPPAIPPKAVLVFETELIDIVGVVQEKLALPTVATDADFSIATAPSTPQADEKVEEEPLPALEATPLSDASPMTTQDGQCNLVGPFAIIVQGALGSLALLALVFKRWRETPKRPWKVWFFDASKQVVGTILVHILNLTMSMLGAMDLASAAQKAVDVAGESVGTNEKKPNPCSFYLLNLAIDTTIGIPVLYLLLKILHVAFLQTPLARPPESIRSGNYGQPPRFNWWLKQSLIYFIGLFGMKLIVLLLFAIFPWLPWVGDWALRWTEGNEAVQIAFVMFIFPLIMNGLQYYIIDSLIMDRDPGKGTEGYQQVQGHDEDGYDERDDEETLAVAEESVHGKDDSPPPLTEINPTPISEENDGVVRRAGGTGRATPKESRSP